MKKNMKHRKYSGHTDPGPDIAGMINKIQEQLASLERKVDTLINKPSSAPVAVKHFSRPFQEHGRSHERGGSSPEGRPGASYSAGGRQQDSSYNRERTLYKATCADCNRECEVPFKPSGDRPVYCKECFSKRKTGSPEGRSASSYKGGGSPNSHQERYDNKPRESSLSPAIHQATHIDRQSGGEKKRHAENRKSPAKRRKAR